MAEGDVWERILHLARRIDEAVAARQGINAEEALQLARAVVSFQNRIANGGASTPGSEGPDAPGESPAASHPLGEVAHVATHAIENRGGDADETETSEPPGAA